MTSSNVNSHSAHDNPDSCTTRVLIAEDEEKTQRYLQQGLRELGFSVEVTGDGHAALTYLVRGDLLAYAHTPTTTSWGRWPSSSGPTRWHRTMAVS